jgi:hypothetical protein
MPQLVANMVVDNTSMVEGAITGNGKYHAYVSPSIATTNNQAIDALFAIHAFLPNRQGLGKAKATLLMERQDDAGNWHTIHALYEPVNAIEYDATENGGIIPAQQLSYGPNIFNLDGAVPIDSSDGVSIILRDHQKRGVLADHIRFCVIVHERDFGNVGAFQSLEFSLDYELRAE